MHICKVFGVMIICSTFAAVAMEPGSSQGQTPGGQGQPPAGTAQDHKSMAKFDYGTVFEALDKNHDGKVTKDEWLASGLSQFTYDNLFDKTLDGNKDGVVTKDEFIASSPQFEVDTNKDGKVSLEEYIAANNGREAIMNVGRGAAPPPTDHGAQGGSVQGEQKK
jgi:hypothetical protein